MTRRALATALAANTIGTAAHSTYMYYLAPIALRNGGILGRDAVIFSLVAIAMGVTVVPAGRLADRVPRRYVFRIGIALLGSSFLALLAPAGLAPIVAGTIASGVGLAFLFLSFQSYVADLLEGSARTSAYARASALGVVATALAPAIAGVVLRTSATTTVGLHVNALLFVALTLLAIALTLALPSARVARPTERGRWHDAARAAGPVAIVYVLMGAGYGMSAPYFTTYFLDHLHFANDAWGYLLALGTLASALGALAAGALSRRFAPMGIVTGGMAALLLTSAAFSAPSATILLLSCAYVGRCLASTTVSPIVSTLLMERAHSARRAESLAYSQVAWNAGWATGGAVGGALLAAIGGSLFLVGAALALAGAGAGVVALRLSGGGTPPAPPGHGNAETRI